MVFQPFYRSDVIRGQSSGYFLCVRVRVRDKVSAIHSENHKSVGHPDFPAADSSKTLRRRIHPNLSGRRIFAIDSAAFVEHCLSEVLFCGGLFRCFFGGGGFLALSHPSGSRTMTLMRFLALVKSRILSTSYRSSAKRGPSALDLWCRKQHNKTINKHKVTYIHMILYQTGHQQEATKADSGKIEQKKSVDTAQHNYKITTKTRMYQVLGI